MNVPFSWKTASILVLHLWCNITIIAGLFTFMFSRLLGERRGAIVAAFGIIFYTLLVGANPAVVRAAILGMFTLLGHQVSRRWVGLNILEIVGVSMGFVTPSVLWDVSFQLSFAATLPHVNDSKFGDYALIITIPYGLSIR